MLKITYIDDHLPMHFINWASSDIRLKTKCCRLHRNTLQRAILVLYAEVGILSSVGFNCVAGNEFSNTTSSCCMLAGSQYGDMFSTSKMRSWQTFATPYTVARAQSHGGNCRFSFGGHSDLCQFLISLAQIHDFGARPIFLHGSSAASWQYLHLSETETG